MKIMTLRTAMWMALGPGLWSHASAQSRPMGSITIEGIADIRYPTEQAWSPDSKYVAFLWDAAGKQDLYIAQPGSKPIALTDFPVDSEIWTSDIASFEWTSADEIIFSTRGSLWKVSVKTHTPERLPGYEGVSLFSLSRDRKEIAFVRDGQIWAGNLVSKAQKQLTRLSDGSRLTAPSFSPDNTYVAFMAAFTSDIPESLPYNGNRLLAPRLRSWNTRVGLVSAFSGDPVFFPADQGAGGVRPIQWAQGPAVVFQVISPDRKTRQIRVGDVSGKVRTVWKDYDPKWWSPANGPYTVVSPDGSMIEFVSDRSGWAHVYVTPVRASSEAEAKQLVQGDDGDGFPSWTPDSKGIAYAHSEKGNQQERFISIADVASGKVTPVVVSRGVNYAPVVSPDGTKIAYLRSAIEHPQEVYAIEAAAGAKPIRLTESMPASINPADLTAPIAVHYPSRIDKASVPATLMVNRNLDKSTKHPAIIWIHGSGSDQNYLGWHPGYYRMYYSISQYFAQQGYVILTPDYRGSSGYSREWTTGAGGDLGGGETQDVNAGADYLKTLPYVNPDRIGIWGLSYGGFMTLQSITVAPKLYACAIDVAGVGDWATFTTSSNVVGRLGGTPVSNPDLFERSAPVKHLDKLERPLLILQGTNDTNVPPWETLKVIDTLEKLGKPFDMAFYPGEIHFFRRAFVLRDAWRRSEAFFDSCLKSPAPLYKSSEVSASTRVAASSEGSAVELR